MVIEGSLKGFGVKSPAAPANQALSVGFKGEEGALGVGGISRGAALPAQTSRPLLALCCALDAQHVMVHVAGERQIYNRVWRDRGR